MLWTQSRYALLDDEVPEVQIIVFAIQFVVRYQSQLLSYLASQMLPVSLYLSSRHKRPKYLLDSQNVLVVPHWLLQRDWRLDFHVLASVTSQVPCSLSLLDVNAGCPRRMYS